MGFQVFCYLVIIVFVEPGIAFYGHSTDIRPIQYSIYILPEIKCFSFHYTHNGNGFAYISMVTDTQLEFYRKYLKQDEQLVWMLVEMVITEDTEKVSCQVFINSKLVTVNIPRLLLLSLLGLKNIDKIDHQKPKFFQRSQ